mmetsp:Transcript_38695/g.110657  ORF Transcript_38695/g.110657 Transcript_38695/m.110657 type:complete len:204 (-) Transcript_38695:141-752(-)
MSPSHPSRSDSCSHFSTVASTSAPASSLTPTSPSASTSTAASALSPLAVREMVFSRANRNSPSTSWNCWCMSVRRSARVLVSKGSPLRYSMSKRKTQTGMLLSTCLRERPVSVWKGSSRCGGEGSTATSSASSTHDSRGPDNASLMWSMMSANLTVTSSRCRENTLNVSPSLPPASSLPSIFLCPSAGGAVLLSAFIRWICAR